MCPLRESVDSGEIVTTVPDHTLAAEGKVPKQFEFYFFHGIHLMLVPLTKAPVLAEAPVRKTFAMLPEERMPGHATIQCPAARRETFESPDRMWRLARC